MKRLLFVALLIVSLPLTAAAADPITWKYAGTVTWTSMSIPLGSATTLLVTVDTDVAPADCGWGDPLFVCFPNALLAVSFSVNGRTWTTTVPTSLGVYQDAFGPVLYAWVDGLVGPNLDSQTPDLLYFWVSVPTLSGPLPTQ